MLCLPVGLCWVLRPFPRLGFSILVGVLVNDYALSERGRRN
jgi:hypothetical protein